VDASWGHALGVEIELDDYSRIMLKLLESTTM
jgi:hypothetical protein